MIVKMIHYLRKRMAKVQEKFTKDLEELNKKQTDEQIIEGINSRITRHNNRLVIWKTRMVEIIATNLNTEKLM